MTTRPLRVLMAGVVALSTSLLSYAQDGAEGKDAPESAQPASTEVPESEILALVNAVDEAEVNAADVALKKNIRQEILDLATMIRTEHAANLEKTKAIAAQIEVVPTETEAVLALRAKEASDLATLAALDGKEFEIAFLNEMITAHGEVIASIDSSLLPSAKSEALKQHLTEARVVVEKHLAEAQRIRDSIEE
jgi:putative membrane protein